MRLNKFVWDNFRSSEQGRASLAFFSNLEERYRTRDPELVKFISHWGKASTLSTDQIDFVSEMDHVTEVMELLRDFDQDETLPIKIENLESAGTYYTEMEGLWQGEDEENPEFIFNVDDVPYISVALYCINPKYFFPYFFYPSFFKLIQIFDEFGIFRPPLPKKSDVTGRFLYYWELCLSIHDFWTGLGLDAIEIPSFLYHFAPNVIGTDVPAFTDLPAPKKAWFIGGGINDNGDFQYLDQVNADTESFWQGNKETEVGDIVVMYCLAPRSHIHSIWRAIRPGAVEPFRGYYGTIWIGKPQIVKPITYKQLRADPVLKEMGLVKGNMQGINGRIIKKEFYDRLLELLRENGTAVSNLPLLSNRENQTVSLKNEKDVETKILEPLLQELGFRPSDWKRQVAVQIGRRERVIPDYLTGIKYGKDSNEVVSADWVWEAKFSIDNHAQLSRDFKQACSYAKVINARGAALISKEGLWLTTALDQFALSHVKHWSAVQLLESDSLAEIRAALKPASR